MACTNVEIVRDLNAGFNRGDDDWIEFYEPEVEYVMPPEWPEEHVLVGHEAVRAAAGTTQ